jgi:hypothetical protein
MENTNDELEMLRDTMISNNEEDIKYYQGKIDKLRREIEVLKLNK